MNLLNSKLKMAFGLSFVAWALVFLATLDRFSSLSPLIPIVPLLIAAGALFLTHRSSPSQTARRVLWIATGLIVVASFCFLGIAAKRERLEDNWQKAEVEQMTEAIVTVGNRVALLQELSTSIGYNIAAFLLQQDQLENDDNVGRRLDAFRVLSEQARRATDGGILPAGTEIGIQLFDAAGDRTAWAGWPQLPGARDQKFLTSGKELIYSRQVSLYRMLTHIIPIYDETKQRLATVLVDMPLEVNYRVNNRFLTSTSLANIVNSKLAADIRLEYNPTPRDLPASMSRTRVTNLADDEPDVLAGTTLPALVKATGGIDGDKISGLKGRVRVLSILGNPLFSLSVSGRPLRHFVDAYHTRYQVVTSLLLFAALLVLFIFSLKRFPRALQGPLGSGKALYFASFFVLIRYWLLGLEAGFTQKFRLFDPAIFATSMLGGVMRSTGDLLITAIVFVIALYGILKITRETGAGVASPQTKSGWGAIAVKGAVAASVLVAVFELTARFAANVVINANPRLVGETMRLFESYTAFLHLSTFLMITGILLSGTIVIWGVYRLGARSGTRRASVIAALLIVVFAAFSWRWDLAGVSLLLLLFIVFAPRIVQREDLVSIVIVAFCFVIIVSTAGYVAFNDEYQGLRRSFIQEKVTELTHPSDNWKVFILEDVLENLLTDNVVRKALTNPQTEDRQRLAFDLWAGSSLSLLGYSSAIHVFNEADSLISRFAVEMPYRVRLSETDERIETTSSQEWVVLDLTTDTPRGMVRFYRGIVNIGNYVQSSIRGEQSLAKVVVDVPFFFENLAWSARTGPQTPEVLRNVQKGGIEPRLEEPEALLLARVRGTRVFESSSDVLPVGFAIEPDMFEKAIRREWPLLETNGPTYRFLVQPTEGDEGSFLLAGFPVPLPHEHILRWSTILSLYFFFAVGILVLLIALKSVRFLRPVLPTLTPGRQLGFQQKLLGSFLIIALCPAVILGIFSVRIIKQRFVEENRKEALSKSFSASKSLSNLLRGELAYLLEHSDIHELVAGNIPRLFASDPDRLVIVFDESGKSVVADDVYEIVDGDTILVPAGGEIAQPLQELGDLAERFPAEQMFVHQVDDKPYLSFVSDPMYVELDGGSRVFSVYYGKLLNEELLGEIAEQVGADISLYDMGELVASSREGLLSGGFISSMMDAEAFVRVSLMDVDHSLASEEAGRYRYEVCYLPVKSAGSTENASIGLPLLFQPESYHVEVQRGTSIVLSIFALLSAATIGLGLLLARGIFEPLKALLEGTRRISRGDLSVKLPEKRRDEIGTVIEAFNEMTHQLSVSQKKLEERRRYLEVILANVATGVVSTDGDDRVRAVNDAAERILGVRAEDVLGRAGDELVSEGVVPHFFGVLASRGEEPFVSSEIDITMEGQKRTIKYMQTRLTSNEQYLGTVYVFEDLTELINSKKLSAWVEMARQIAHEIKNPLTPIKLSTQFMVRAHNEKAENFNQIFKEGADTIIHQVEVLRRIATEFSSFGRLQQLKVGRHDVVKQIQEIAGPYARNDSGIDLSLTCPDHKLMASVDPEAFRKVCTNLIENALEAMPDGGALRIRCGNALQGDNDRVWVSFTDTGQGISDEVQERLFEPYFSTKTTGTGLGLAICRSLSREMGGDVVIRNLDNGDGVEAKLFLKKSA